LDSVYSWGHSRPFNAYSNYFKKQFGKRIQKVSIDAGFSCPNRDGSVSTGGCAYCNNDSFNPSYCTPQKSVSEQIATGIEFHSRRYRNADQYLAYFQAFSNTYKPLDELKKIYKEATDNPNVIGFVIGTRPDCIDDEKLEFFKELSEKYYVIIEYGLESCYDSTLSRINRGHNFECSRTAIMRTAELGIRVGAHMLFGLPGESRQQMLDQAEILSDLPLNNIKFHQLQIIKNTRFEKEYLENPSSFKLFDLEEYIDFIVEFVERLNPCFVIERFASESPPAVRLAPDWKGTRNERVVSLIENSFKKKNTWQGKFCAIRPEVVS